MRRVVAAMEEQSGKLTVVCDDGSVFTYGGDKWRESTPPVPGTPAAAQKEGKATAKVVRSPWAQPPG